jgi:hypothetical protein
MRDGYPTSDPTCLRETTISTVRRDGDGRRHQRVDEPVDLAGVLFAHRTTDQHGAVRQETSGRVLVWRRPP